MYLQCLVSSCGSNVSANCVLTAELAPSAAITRSWVAVSRATSGASARNAAVTPRSAQRCCRIASSRRRLIAAKPCPPLVIVSPLKCTSMSSQRANSRSIAR